MVTSSALDAQAPLGSVAFFKVQPIERSVGVCHGDGVCEIRTTLMFKVTGRPGPIRAQAGPPTQRGLTVFGAAFRAKVRLRVGGLGLAGSRLSSLFPFDRSTNC